ncbi:MAG: phospho-N-acetylmuramoyl-pentapeptide-transferase [Saprospiraceae bacterium]|nr:phospho-N-acetylmuramoyl-pentapeptide-transferase [Lewinella sp.]
MLIQFLEWFRDNVWDFPGSGLVNYVTFRAGLATILSLIISMIFGGKIIQYLKRLQVGETVRDLGLTGQKAKEGTPTMGGVIIIMAILIPCLLVCDLSNVYVLLMIISTIWMGIIGFIDDYIKVFRKDKEGLKGSFKILGQVGLGLIIALTMMFSDQVVVRTDVATAQEMHFEEQRVSEITQVAKANGKLEAKADYKALITNVPFTKGNRLDYRSLIPLPREKAGNWVWLLFIPLIIVIVSAVSNGANLTDGLDGLATGVSGIVGLTLAVFAYVSSNAIAADYLGIIQLPGTQELTIFAACFLGASLGFLWYNSYPATVFMGDTGSLTIGGIIAAMAILLRKELLIPFICVIFLAENISVMMQVGYFKYTRRKYGEGRRLFLMAPLHHHYQKKGISEVKIVTRFWIVSILFAVFTILTLKIR